MITEAIKTLLSKEWQSDRNLFILAYRICVYITNSLQIQGARKFKIHIHDIFQSSWPSAMPWQQNPQTDATCIKKGFEFYDSSSSENTTIAAEDVKIAHNHRILEQLQVCSQIDIIIRFK
jgi:hypothetical protein